MKTAAISFTCILITAFSSSPAHSYFHGNSYGGSTYHSPGSTTHTNTWGGSTTHNAGEGTTHDNVYGGSATHYAGGGWSKTGAYGGTAYGNAHYGSSYYYGYHPPTAVNYYGSGCYNCGGWATGAAVVAGAAVTTAAVAATYNATHPVYVMGSVYPTLPVSCTSVVVGMPYYQCGTAWFKPYYGANGIYYTVVPAP